MISVRFQGKPFNITVIWNYTPPNQSCWRNWSWMVLWRPTRFSRTNTQKRCPFHSRGLECKSRKSRNTWSNRQIWPWSMEWSRSKANRVFPRECTGHSKHPLPITQEKTLHMDITRWPTLKSDWLFFCSQRWKSSIQSAKTRVGADCGPDHELLFAKFKLKLKNVGKNTRPFRYDLNQICYAPSPYFRTVRESKSTTVMQRQEGSLFLVR